MTGLINRIAAQTNLLRPWNATTKRTLPERPARDFAIVRPGGEALARGDRKGGGRPRISPGRQRDSKHNGTLGAAIEAILTMVREWTCCPRRSAEPIEPAGLRQPVRSHIMLTRPPLCPAMSPLPSRHRWPWPTRPPRRRLGCGTRGRTRGPDQRPPGTDRQLRDDVRAAQGVMVGIFDLFLVGCKSGLTSPASNWAWCRTALAADSLFDHIISRAQDSVGEILQAERLGGP